MPTISKANVEASYQAALHPYLLAATATADAMLDLALHLYEELKINGVGTDDPDSDMLLFQYGTYDWGGPLGKHFSLDITRQFERHDFEQLYQVALTLYFDPAPFANCAGFNAWSADAPTLVEWRERMQATPGFQLARTQTPKTVVIKLDKV